MVKFKKRSPSNVLGNMMSSKEKKFVGRAGKKGDILAHCTISTE